MLYVICVHRKRGCAVQCCVLVRDSGARLGCANGTCASWRSALCSPFGRVVDASSGMLCRQVRLRVIQTLFPWFPTSCVIIVVSQLAGCAATVAPDGLPLRHPPVAAPYGCFYGRVQRAHAVGHRRHHCSDHANQNFRVDRLRSHLHAAQLGHGTFASQLPTWGQNTQQFIHNASTRMARVVHLCPCLWDRRVVNLRTRAVLPTCDAVAPGPCRSTRPQPYPS